MTRVRQTLKCSGFCQIGVLGLLTFAAPLGYGQTLESIWDKSDATNTATIDHADWQVVLDTYLITDDPSGVHLFDYRALQANTEDRQRLNRYLGIFRSWILASIREMFKWRTGSIFTMR